MDEVKKIALLAGLLLSFCAPVFAVDQPRHQIGAGYGWGKPDDLQGYRVLYRFHWLHYGYFQLDLEASHGRFQLNSQYEDKVNTTAVAPVFRFMMPPACAFRFYLEGSVGPSRISTKHLGGKHFGSKWNFQDLMGGGMIYKNWDISVHYLHYSNAKLAMPNPGIDIIPLATLSYRF